MPRPEPSQGYRVLVVEDEGLIAQDISRRLASLGHQVIGPASTADEALALAPGAEIVLMDIRIDGDRDGIDAAVEIRARYRLPVIFLTAHADRSTLERAKQASPFGFIVKPVGPASLQAGIEMAVAKHRTERLLEEREVWLRSVVGCIADAAVVVGRDGRVRLLNQAAEQSVGWTQAEAEGQPVDQVVRLRNSDQEDEFEPIPLALLRGEPVEFSRKATLISRDGREVEVDGFAAPVRTSQEILGAVLTFRDASARHWEERQFQQAQRLEAAARLAASAAAEYSALIGIIRKHNEQLLRQFGEFSAARGALEEIHRAAVAAGDITRRLEVFGTRQVGQPETLSLNGVLRRMARLIESATIECRHPNGIQLALRPSPTAGRIRVDAAQLEAAILSLVSHACDVMTEGGKLLVDTAKVDRPSAGLATSYALLGITYSAAEPDIEHLFDPASISGSSLALAQVHWLAAECGGSISARSMSNGGSRIELLIPRLSDEELPTNVESEVATILLVEHRDAVRAELHKFFEAAGYNLIEAIDAAEAVALGEMHEGRLDLVIAESNQACEILRHLRDLHPTMQTLRVVEHADPRQGEIRRSFTELELIEKVAARLTEQIQQACPATA